MSAVEITDVTIQQPLSVTELSLDAPQPRSRRESHDFKLVGCIVGAEGRVLAIELVHGADVVRSAPVAVPRPDVAARHPDADWAASSGFWTLVGVVGLPTDFELHIVARFASGARESVGTIRGRHGAVASEYPPKLKPVMLTSLGRTGTTWLMRLLIEHPSILADVRYPYETRFGRYWAHAFRVLAEPGNHAQSSHPDDFQQNRYMTGHNPFYMGYLTEGGGMASWFGRRQVERLAAFVQQTIDSFYGELGRVQQRTEASWFLEKNLPDYVAATLWELYPGGREIVLVRDFRDMAASMIAFNRKRGRLSFGAENAAGEEDFIRRLRTGALKLQSAWQERRDRALLIRYEDLVTDPATSLRAVLDYLGEDVTPDAVEHMISRADADQSALAAHRTSAEAESSIGRWRVDLDESLKLVCAEAFDDILPDFGYEQTSW